MTKKRIAIIGAGISGLSAAYYLEKNAKEAGLEIEIELIEKRDRTGGNIVTDRQDNFTVEGGPDCVFSEKPAALGLCKELNLTEELIKTCEEKKGTYVYWNKRLHDLPEGVVLMIPTMIKPMVFSSLISWSGKLRMACELFIPRRTDPGEETLGEFVSRRLGKEMLEKIAEPLVAGIHAGSPETMSINASFPRFVDLEKKYGSLIKGVLARKKEMAARGGTGKSKYTMFMSLKDGLQVLPDTIKKNLKHTKISLDKEVLSIEKESEQYIVNLMSKETVTVDSVIIASPSHATAEILKEFAPSLSDQLTTIPYVSTATVSLAYSKESFTRSPKGFGCIVPRMANRKIMAATMTSNKFSFRTPEGGVLIRAFVGGAKNEKLTSLDDDEMIEMVKKEIKDIIGFDAVPSFVKVFRWNKSMPQYTIGHENRINLIKKSISEFPGLYLTGSAYNGIGISDCIVTSRKMTEQVIGSLKQ